MWASENCKKRHLNIRIFLLALYDRGPGACNRWLSRFRGIWRRRQQISALLVRFKILLQLRESCQQLANDLLLIRSCLAGEKSVQVSLQIPRIQLGAWIET